MARTPQSFARRRERELRATLGVPLAAGSREPFIAADQAWLLEPSSIERLDIVPFGPPEIVIEEI